MDDSVSEKADEEPALSLEPATPPRTTPPESTEQTPDKDADSLMEETPVKKSKDITVTSIKKASRTHAPATPTIETPSGRTTRRKDPCGVCGAPACGSIEGVNSCVSCRDFYSQASSRLLFVNFKCIFVCYQNVLGMRRLFQSLRYQY